MTLCTTELRRMLLIAQCNAECHVDAVAVSQSVAVGRSVTQSQFQYGQVSQSVT